MNAYKKPLSAEELGAQCGISRPSSTSGGDHDDSGSVCGSESSSKGTVGRTVGNGGAKITKARGLCAAVRDRFGDHGIVGQ